MNIHSLTKKENGTMKNAEIKKLKSEKYHRILNAAIKVFAEQGFFRSTISQIAKEAGVADGTIYLYFKNKDDILLQFFTYKTKEIFSRFREDVDKVDNAKEKLRSFIKRHFQEFQQDINMAIVFQAEARQRREFEMYLQDLSKMYFDVIGDIIEQGQEEGTIRKDLYLGLVKRFILGAVDEVINTWVKAGGKYDLASMADPLVDLYFRGIGGDDSSK